MFGGVIRDPIYGYIDYVKGVEDKVIDSWPLQRLRYIYQLQTAHFIYPGATHTRFNHSIGVMFSSYKYVNYLARTMSAPNLPSEFTKEVSTKFKEILLGARLLGLLHDVGHGPLSHAFDRYVYRGTKILPYRVGNHEVMGFVIYKHYLRDLIKTALEKSPYSFDSEYVLWVLDNGMKPPPGMYEFTDLVSKGILEKSDFYEPKRGQFIENVVRMVVRDYVYTSDIMDYLKRDSYFTGIPIGEINDEWIMRNSYIVETDGRLLIGVAEKALDEVGRLFDARKIMYKSVYLHPVNLAFIDTMGRLLDCIKTSLAEAIEAYLNNPAESVAYISLTDHFIYSTLHRLYVKGLEGVECEDRDFAQRALRTLFINRKPVWKMIKRFSTDLRIASHLFSPRFGEDLRRRMVEEINEEAAKKLGPKIVEGDINVIAEKIDIYPSAGAEIVDYLTVVEARDGALVSVTKKKLDDFAREYGLIPEALFTVYVSRDKYAGLDQSDLKKLIEISEEVIRDAIKGQGKEAPETS